MSDIAEVMEAEESENPPREEVPEGEVSTVELEVPVSQLHDTIIETLEQSGIDVEEQLEQGLQPQVESTIHDLFQQIRYQQ